MERNNCLRKDLNSDYSTTTHPLKRNNYLGTTHLVDRNNCLRRVRGLKACNKMVIGTPKLQSQLMTMRYVEGVLLANYTAYFLRRMPRVM